MNTILEIGRLSTVRNFSQPSRYLKTLPLLLGLVMLSACQSPPAPLSSQSVAALPRVLSVSGTGETQIPTTIAKVNLGVQVEGKTATEVQQEMAKRSQAVVKLLKERKVDELETTGIQLNPNYNYQNNEQRIIGYTATNTVTFEMPVAQVGNLLDETVKVGATRIDGISFVASDEAIATAQQEALKKATEAAKKQAEAVLTTLNFDQKEILGIQINGNNMPPYPIPIMQTMNMAAETKVASTPVEGGKQQIQASVTLQIRY